MRLCRTFYQFSKFQEKLNALKKSKDTISTQQTIPPLEQTQQKPPPPLNNQALLNVDLTAIIKTTPEDGTIYKNQPKYDTINQRELAEIDPYFNKNKDEENFKFHISGEESQIAMVDIFPGQKVRSESDKIIYMTAGVQMNTHTSGGIGSMFKRFFGGSSLFVTDYTYTEQEGFGRVAFAETFPSKILPIRLDEYNGVINCKKGSYICSSPEVDVNITFQKSFRAGFFGGEGFPGQVALLRAGGCLIKRKLRQGEKWRIKVAPGLVVAFEKTVDYDIEFASKKNWLNIFGGSRNLFFATFTGPGDIFLQSLSFEALVEEISSRIPSRGGGGGSRSSSKGDSEEGESKEEAEEGEEGEEEQEEK